MTDQLYHMQAAENIENDEQKIIIQNKESLKLVLIISATQ
jgi:hypothetical protein